MAAGVCSPLRGAAAAAMVRVAAAVSGWLDGAASAWSTAAGGGAPPAWLRLSAWESKSLPLPSRSGADAGCNRTAWWTAERASSQRCRPQCWKASASHHHTVAELGAAGSTSSTCRNRSALSSASLGSGGRSSADRHRSSTAEEVVLSAGIFTVTCSNGACDSARLARTGRAVWRSLRDSRTVQNGKRGKLARGRTPAHTAVAAPATRSPRG